jgi:hypothetical protein
MTSNNQTERSHAGQASALNRAMNTPPHALDSEKRPSTPQHYKEHPELLKSVFEWSPARTSTPVEEDERSSSEGRQRHNDPTVPTRSLRRITKKIPERNHARQRETRTDLRQRNTTESRSDSTDHTSTDSIVSLKASSTFTIYGGPNPFVQTDTDAESVTTLPPSDVVSSKSFTARLSISTHSGQRGTGR